MNLIKNLILFTIAVILIFGGTSAYAQGAIINELSQGPSGSNEFIELMVVGGALGDTSPVDFTDWILDDNNGNPGGQFNATNGSASGHLQFTGACLSSVPVGSFILVYNDASLSLGNDPTDMDGDGVYIIPVSNNTCLRRCTTLPTSSNPSYNCASYSAGGVWARIGMANGNDAVQLRDSNANFYHGFSYGSSMGPGTTFNLSVSGSGSNRTYYFTCGGYNTNVGDDSNPVYLQRGASTSPGETPGEVNSESNLAFQELVTAGTFDYGDAENQCGSTTAALADPFYGLSVDSMPAGNWLRWSQSAMSSTTAYHLFARRESGEVERLTHAPLGTSNIFLGLKSNPKYTSEYTFFDEEGDGSDYWLESSDGLRTVDFNNQSASSSDSQLISMIQTTFTDSNHWEFDREDFITYGNESEHPVSERCESLLASDAFAVQTVLASSHNSLKIVPNQKGWQRFDGSELSMFSGVDAGVFYKGTQIPARVIKDGGVIQAVEFFAAHSGDVYWLSPEFHAKEFVPAPVTSDLLRIQEGWGKVVLEPKVVYAPSLLDGEGDNFYGPVLQEDVAVSLSVSTKGVDSSNTTDMAWGRFEFAGTDENIRVEVAVNGNVLKTVTSYEKFKIPHDFLNDENTWTLTRTNPEGVVALKTFEIDYLQNYICDDDVNIFRIEAGQSADIAGCDGVWNAFDIEAGIELEVTPSLRGQQVNIPGKGIRRIAMVREGQGHKPHLAAYTPSEWSSRTNQAGLMIVKTDETGRAAEALAVHRQSQGWDVDVVDIESIYNEFSFGHPSAKAIECFAAHTKNWKRTPLHWLLFGDATFDVQGVLGASDFSGIPTFIHGDPIETADDQHLMSSLGLSAVVGRIPARTTEHADGFVQKLIAYDDNTQIYSKGLMIADEKDGYNFMQRSEDIGVAINESWETSLLDLGEQSIEQSQDQLQRLLSEGVNTLSFLGHGSVELWAGRFLSSSSPDGFVHTGRPPVVMGLSCLGGFFHDIYTTSIGESWVLAEEGAIAFIGSSQLSHLGQQQIFGSKLLGALTEANHATLGQAFEEAHNESQQIVLLGDPSMQPKEMSTAFTNTNDPRLGIKLSSHDDGTDEHHPMDNVPLVDQTGGCNSGGGGFALSGLFVCALAIMRRRKQFLS